MTSWSRRWCATPLAAALLACGAPGTHEAPAGAATRDAAWRDLPLTDSLRPVTPRSPVAMPGDGLVAVSVLGLDDGSQFAVVDTQGRLVGRFGRTGGGPGELGTPAQAFPGPNGLWVYDMAALRASAYSVEGKPLAQVQLSGAVFPASGTTAGVLALALTTDGGIEVREYSSDRPEGWAGFGAVGPSDFDRLVAAPFAAASNESKLELVPALAGNDSMIVVGYPDRFALFWFRRADGGLIDSVLVAAPPNLPTTVMVTRYRAEVGGSQPGALSGEQLERAVAAYEQSERPHFHRYGGLMLDSTRTLWVASTRADSVTISRVTPVGVAGAWRFPCPGFAGSWGMHGRLVAAGCLEGDVPGVRLVTLAGG